MSLPSKFGGLIKVGLLSSVITILLDYLKERKNHTNPTSLKTRSKASKRVCWVVCCDFGEAFGLRKIETVILVGSLL